MEPVSLAHIVTSFEDEIQLAKKFS